VFLLYLNYFYWKRDIKINSIKAEFYDKNKFEETSKFIKLCVMNILIFHMVKKKKKKKKFELFS